MGCFEDFFLVVGDGFHVAFADEVEMSGDMPWYLESACVDGWAAVVVSESEHFDDGCCGCGVAVVVRVNASCGVGYGFGFACDELGV